MQAKEAYFGKAQYLGHAGIVDIAKVKLQSTDLEGLQFRWPDKTSAHRGGIRLVRLAAHNERRREAKGNVNILESMIVIRLMP